MQEEAESRRYSQGWLAGGHWSDNLSDHWHGRYCHPNRQVCPWLHLALCPSCVALAWFESRWCRGLPLCYPLEERFVRLQISPSEQEDEECIKPCSWTGACAAHELRKRRTIRFRLPSSWTCRCTGLLFLAPLDVLRALGTTMLAFSNLVYSVPCLDFHSIWADCRFGVSAELIYCLCQHGFIQLFQGNVSMQTILLLTVDS